MDEMQKIVDDLFRSGLTIEQQCNVSALLTYIATHFVTRQIPLTSAERTRNYRARQKVKRETSHVTKSDGKGLDINNNIINNNIPRKPTQREMGVNPRAIGTNPKALGTNPRALRQKTGDAKFDEFWEVYPRKIAKPAALKSWVRAIQNGANPDEIISGAKRYAAKVRGESPIYTKYPQGWISDARWADETETKTNGKSYLGTGNPLQFKEKDEPEWVPPTPEERERRLRAVEALKAATQAMTR